MSYEDKLKACCKPNSSKFNKKQNARQEHVSKPLQSRNRLKVTNYLAQPIFTLINLTLNHILMIAHCEHINLKRYRNKNINVLLVEKKTFLFPFTFLYFAHCLHEYEICYGKKIHLC